MAGNDQGVYRIGMWGRLPGAARRVRVLPDAVVPPDSSAPRAFGWVAGVLPTPGAHDRYFVEFVSADEFRILAYADRFGRAFSVDAPITAPPARYPDLAFSRFADPSSDGHDNGSDDESGVIEVRLADGGTARVAEFRSHRGVYEIVGSWYRFGDDGANLSYPDALARAYFAFVYRPTAFAVPVFESGLEPIYRLLREDDLVDALEGVVDAVRTADADPALRPPALAVLLARWLEEADLDEALRAERSGGAKLRLVRTERYADLFYVAREDDSPVRRSVVWAIEAALNRFLLAAEFLGDGLAASTIAECEAVDAAIRENVGFLTLADPACSQAGDSAPVGSFGYREWDARARIAVAIESLRLPYRVEVDFRLDMAAGIASFSATVPGADLMPAAAWSEAAGAWEPVSDADRIRAARGYAQRVGIVLASIAFSASPYIVNASVALVAAPDDRTPGVVAPAGEVGSRAFGAGADTACVVAFTRASVYGADALADPEAVYRAADAAFAPADDIDPFAAVRALPVYEERRDLPEVGSRPLSDAARRVLGARTTRDLRIFDMAERRRTAERLAGGIASAATAAESVALVRDVQDATGDPFVHEACTRLMVALAEGTIDTGDQNDVVNTFLGEDRLLAAVGKARSLAAASSWRAAVDTLKEAIAQADEGGRYVDTTEIVHRSFDSYTSRVMYNLVREGRVPWIAEGTSFLADEASASVELVPDSLYVCCLELSGLLVRSVDRAQEALHYAQRCVQMGPTIAAGYRQLARAAMQADRMAEAREALVRCLQIAVSPDDISVAYYQMAYVEWKLGRLEPAVALYLKSLSTSSVVVVQASLELRRLIHESGTPVPDRDDVDAILRAADIPIVPVDDIVRLADDAAAAAVDSGVFPVAHNLLSLRLRHRADDALVLLARSLT